MRRDDSLEKTLMQGKIEEKGVTEDEMVGWHHWLNGHEIRTEKWAFNVYFHAGQFSKWAHSTGSSFCLKWMNRAIMWLKTWTVELRSISSVISNWIWTLSQFSSVTTFIFYRDEKSSNILCGHLNYSEFYFWKSAVVFQLGVYLTHGISVGLSA